MQQETKKLTIIRQCYAKSYSLHSELPIHQFYVKNVFFHNKPPITITPVDTLYSFYTSIEHFNHHNHFTLN